MKIGFLFLALCFAFACFPTALAYKKPPRWRSIPMLFMAMLICGFTACVVPA